MSLKKSDLGTHVVPFGFKSLVTIPFSSFRISQEKKFDGFGLADTLSKPETYHEQNIQNHKHRNMKEKFI